MAEEIKRNYVVPLRRGFVNTPRYKRTNKAVRVLREFMIKHMKSEDIKIGPKLNLLLWEKGIKNPPGKVEVTAIKNKEGTVKVELIGHDYVDFKQQEKVNKNASFKEKLQEKMKVAKETNKTESKAEEKAATKEVAKETKAATPAKATKEEAPVKEESSESEEKAPAKTEEKEDSDKAE